MKRLAIAILLLLLATAAWSQSLVGVWEGGPIQYNREVTYTYQIRFTPDGSTRMTYVYMLEPDSDIKIEMSFSLSGAYERQGKALSMTYDKTVSGPERKYHFGPNSGFNSQQKALFEREMNKLIDQMIPELRRMISLISTSGNYRQITMLNEKDLWIDRPGSKTEKLRRIASGANE